MTINSTIDSKDVELCNYRPNEVSDSRVIAGLDRLNVTFHTSISLAKVLSEMFGVSWQTLEQRTKSIKWYRKRHDCKSQLGHTLFVVHSEPTGPYGNRNLLGINGLALSNLAYNPFRDVPIEHIFNVISKNDGTISGFDCYLDSFTNLVPLDRLMVQALPQNYRRFIRSPLVKDHSHTPTLPRIVGGSSIYYGRRGRSACQVLAYDKRKCPHQDIWTPENRLKHPYHRIELRLRNQAARREGRQFIDSLIWFDDGPPVPYSQAFTQIITRLFQHYWTPIDPTHTRPSNCDPQQWYIELLQRAVSL